MKDPNMIYRTHLSGTQAISPFCCEAHKIQALRSFVEPSLRQLKSWAGSNIPVTGENMAKLQDIITSRVAKDDRSADTPWIRSLAFTVYSSGFMDVAGFLVDVEVLTAYGANLECAAQGGVN